MSCDFYRVARKEVVQNNRKTEIATVFSALNIGEENLHGFHKLNIYTPTFRSKEARKRLVLSHETLSTYSGDRKKDLPFIVEGSLNRELYDAFKELISGVPIEDNPSIVLRDNDKNKFIEVSGMEIDDLLLMELQFRYISAGRETGVCLTPGGICGITDGKIRTFKRKIHEISSPDYNEIEAEFLALRDKVRKYGKLK